MSLGEYRKEMYDLNDGEEDGEIDPTRRGDFDLADASLLAQGMAEKAKSEKNVKKAEEKKPKDGKAPLEAKEKESDLPFEEEK